MSFSEMLQHMCTRPRMFVPSGTFIEICIFLDGYNCALYDYASEDVKKESKETGLGEFGRWLSYTHENDEMIWLNDGKEIAANLVWWEKFRRLYPVDSEAFEALPLLYQKFLDDPRRSSWPNWPSYTDVT